MIERLIRTSLEQRVIVLLAAFGVSIDGAFAFRSLPIDAFPDVTPVQVQVITRAPSLAPPEIERLVTFPLEIELINAWKNRTPIGLAVRDLSHYGGV